MEKDAGCQNERKESRWRESRWGNLGESSEGTNASQWDNDRPVVRDEVEAEDVFEMKSVCIQETMPCECSFVVDTRVTSLSSCSALDTLTLLKRWNLLAGSHDLQVSAQALREGISS